MRLHFRLNGLNNHNFKTDKHFFTRFTSNYKIVSFFLYITFPQYGAAYVLVINYYIKMSI